MDLSDYMFQNYLSNGQQRTQLRQVGALRPFLVNPGNVSIKSRETTVSQDFTGEACQGNEGASPVLARWRL